MILDFVTYVEEKKKKKKRVHTMMTCVRLAAGHMEVSPLHNRADRTIAIRGPGVAWCHEVTR